MNFITSPDRPIFMETWKTKGYISLTLGRFPFVRTGRRPDRAFPT